jgi:general secretion pathway protein B
LPSAARARFPGIVFSTHIYAEDADLRAIVANGQRLREGERVRGLRIREITETGVVLAFEDYLVEVPIVTDWDTLP